MGKKVTAIRHLAQSRVEHTETDRQSVTEDTNSRNGNGLASQHWVVFTSKRKERRKEVCWLSRATAAAVAPSDQMPDSGEREREREREMWSSSSRWAPLVAMGNTWPGQARPEQTTFLHTHRDWQRIKSKWPMQQQKSNNKRTKVSWGCSSSSSGQQSSFSHRQSGSNTTYLDVSCACTHSRPSPITGWQKWKRNRWWWGWYCGITYKQGMSSSVCVQSVCLCRVH